MKVDGYAPIKNNGGVRKRGDVSGGVSFADMLNDAEAAGETPHLSGTSDVAATAALSSMLAMQEITEEDVRRKKAMQQGNNILDTLEQLRRQLLLGTLPMQTLRDIGRQLSIQREQLTDPHLTAIMDDIELRAAVELAKLEMAMAAKSMLD